MKKYLYLALATLFIFTAFLTGCSSENNTTKQATTDKFVGTYYAPPKPNNFKPVEEITITKEGDKYFLEGKQWEYEYTKIEGNNYTIEPISKPINKVPIEVKDNSIIVPATLGNKITLTLQNNNLTGTNVGQENYQATYTKSKEQFKEYMAKAAEGCKKVYTNFGKNVTINNEKLNNITK